MSCPARANSQGKEDQFMHLSDMWLTVFKDYDRQVMAGDRKTEYVDHLKRYNRLYWEPAFKGTDIREINPRNSPITK